MEMERTGKQPKTAEANEKEKYEETSSVGFQSRDPIISIPIDEKKLAKAKEAGGQGGHGFTVEHPTSYVETLMHLFKGNVGSGLFAMGDAVKNAGILLSPPVIVILGVICVHSQHLLLNASYRMKKYLDMDTYPDFASTVELCFATGPKSLQKCAPYVRILINIFLCVTQLGFCCVYFVFISSNFKQVLDYYGWTLDVHFHMAIILLPILLSSMVRNLKYLAPLSTLANVLMLIGIVITTYYASQDLPKISERAYVAEWHQLPLFFGTALFAFEGIGLVLPLKSEMKKPKMFGRPFGVLNVGMTVVIFLYTALGFMAYLKYGENVQGSVSLNLPKDLVLSQSVKIMISLGILLTYALQFYIPVEIMWPDVQKLLGPFNYPVCAELLFRTFLVCVTFVLAEAIPYLGLFISLVGAVSSTALALIFPPMINLVSLSTVSEVSKITIVKDVLIILLGVLGCITGTYESLHQIVEAFRSAK